VGVTILLFIVAQIPGIEGIKPYLLTEQYENWHGLLRTPTDWTADLALGVGLRTVRGSLRCSRRIWCFCAATSRVAEASSDYETARFSDRRYVAIAKPFASVASLSPLRTRATLNPALEESLRLSA